MRYKEKLLSSISLENGTLNRSEESLGRESAASD